METIWQWGLSVIVWLQQFRTPVLDAGMRALSFMGEEEFYLLLIPFLSWCVDFGMGVRVGIIFLLSVEINGILKDVLQQPRPFDRDPGVKLEDAPGYGLPSGHAQSSTVVWGSVARWARNVWVWVVALGVILLIGVSRVYLGVHFPTDVLGGWATGAALLGVYFVVLSSSTNPARHLSTGAQLAAAGLLPVLLILLHPTKDNVSAMGALTGVGIGFALTWRFIPFSARGPWLQRGARYVMGAIVAIAIYGGLRAVFPGESSPFFFVFRFLRYGLIGLWTALGAPWVFYKLRLAPAMGRH